MSNLFISLINMSIAAGWLILAVVVIRLLLKKAPRWISCVLWALVGIRLICPFSPESILSLIPSAETLPATSLYTDSPMIHSGIAILNSTVNPVISESLAPAKFISLIRFLILLLINIDEPTSIGIVRLATNPYVW